MSSKRKNNTYKAAILLLSFFLLVVLFKSYKDNESAIELQDTLKQETLITQNQLSEILTKYDSVSNLYANFEQSFSDLSSKVSDLKDPKKNIKFKNLAELNKEIDQIKDSIKLLKEKLKQIEKLKTLIKPEVKATKVTENTILKDAKFEVTNLQVKGVKFLTDNKTPNKVKPIEQIRVCFTVDRNKSISSGEKEFFVQVVNPKNDIVSVDELTFEYDNTTLKYSKLVKFDYQQQVTDVCSYVDLEKNKTVKGRYIVNLYSGTTKISSTIFNYN
jgi:hypothetical protein